MGLQSGPSTDLERAVAEVIDSLLLQLSSDIVTVTYSRHPASDGIWFVDLIPTTDEWAAVALTVAGDEFSAMVGMDQHLIGDAVAGRPPRNLRDYLKAAITGDAGNVRRALRRLPSA